MEDTFRSIPIRHLGHGFAFAEAFRYNFSGETCDLCATLATAYILCHAGYRGFQTYPYQSKRAVAPLSSLVLNKLVGPHDHFSSALITFIGCLCQELALRRGKLTLSTLFDTLIFDGLASALVPSVLTFYVCQITDSILQSISGAPAAVVEWGPLVMGCATLLLTWEAIDIGVNNLMNDTIRKFY